ncbi:MAG: nitrite reductase small subunit NirD [Alphaproteobacteria bacterium]
MAGWLAICRSDEIPRQGARVVCGPDGPIAVFRTGDDRYFALADRCPHRGGPLSQGIVHGDRVTCPLHEWMIDLGSGMAVAPDDGATASYPVQIEAGLVMLRLDAVRPACSTAVPAIGLAP